MVSMYDRPYAKRMNISDLANVPDLTGHAGEFLAVNILESAIEICNPSTGIDTNLTGGIPSSTYESNQMINCGEPDTDYSGCIQMTGGDP